MNFSMMNLNPTSCRFVIGWSVLLLTFFSNSLLPTVALAPIPVHDGDTERTPPPKVSATVKPRSNKATISNPKALAFPRGQTFYNGLPTNIPTPRTNGVSDAQATLQHATGNVRLTREQTGWFYQAQQPLQYQQLKTAWLQQNSGATPTLYTLELLAYQAAFATDKGTPVWLPLHRWRMVGTPNPWVVSPRISVENNTTEAIANLHIQTQVKVRLGVWYPKVPTALLDIERLQKTGAWLTLQQESIQLKPLPANGLAVETLPAVSILRLLKAHPDKFPLTFQLSVWLFEGTQTTPSDTLVLELPCHPDIFALPIYLY
jgi:hypothetical protein